jgi:LmbE family N-acetylglucosaminyl deacetylase
MADIGIDTLAGELLAMADTALPDLLLVFDEGGVTGHPDHQRVTEAARHAARSRQLRVAAWALPDHVAQALNAEFGMGFVGRSPSELDFQLRVDRSHQRQAIACHRSQSRENPVLRRRLELLGDTEWLRSLDGDATSTNQT